MCLQVVKHYGISSHREYLQLSELPTVVESTSSCPIVGVYPEYLELSRGPPIVGSISVCQEQLSGVPRLVEGTSNSRTCREQLSGLPRVVEGTSNSHKYLRLPGAVIRSTWSCRGDLHQSEVSPLARSTSSCPKYSSCQEHQPLSKVPPVVESDFCQTGSVIPPICQHPDLGFCTDQGVKTGAQIIFFP